MKTKSVISPQFCVNVLFRLQKETLRKYGFEVFTEKGVGDNIVVVRTRLENSSAALLLVKAKIINNTGGDN